MIDLTFFTIQFIFQFRYQTYDFEEDEEDELDHSQMAALAGIPSRHSNDRIYPEQYQYFNSARDLTLPLQKHSNYPKYQESSPDSSEEVSLRKYLGVSVGLISLITENLLSHPFIVLRRQCQVHHNSLKFHLIPVTLVPIIVHLHRRQGITTLWKGIGSVLLVRGMTLAVEDVLSKFTPWPKEINSRTSMKQFGQHMLLKCISLATVLPFYTASLVETVQSDIASEKPGILDVFREGAARLFSWKTPQKGRMLPVWQLIGPSVSLGLTKYLTGVIIKGITTRFIGRRIIAKEEQKGARSKDMTAINNDIELYSNITSLITTEILFYPFETILHRIQLQGTRTIIDNLDTGCTVVPILTNYEGAIDCYVSTIQSEGFGGLYKGFGAVILQFAAHLLVIKLSKWVITQIAEVCSEKPPPNVTEFYKLEPSTLSQQKHSNSGNSTVSRSLSYVSSLNDDA